MIKALKGMKDIAPEQSPVWQRLEGIACGILSAYGYEQIRLPIMETTALFERSIGEYTDIVEKEMYTFTDRNGSSVTLRPEGTAGCVRAGLEHDWFATQGRRLWYLGPMFRHERPQEGRLRQFHQIGVEAFSMPGPDIDAELILLTARLWQALGLHNLRLEINTLGTAQARAQYRSELVTYFSRRAAELDEDSQRRLEKNPLRILDSKNPAMQDLIAEAPTFEHYLDDESQRHFDQLQHLLRKNDIDYLLNPRLVRGLDYYNRTIFEWVTEDLGAQGTVCGGGRYDGLVQYFGGKAVPAIGFAMGLERLVSLIEKQDSALGRAPPPHIYFISQGDDALGDALVLAEHLRDAIPGLRLTTHCGGGSFKSQFKKADKSGALLAVIIGADEMAGKSASIKFMRGEQEQKTVPQAELKQAILEAINRGADERIDQYETTS